MHIVIFTNIRKERSSSVGRTLDICIKDRRIASSTLSGVTVVCPLAKIVRLLLCNGST